MIQMENANGVIDISSHFFTTLIGRTVSQCFGVVGMSTTGRVQDVATRLPFLPQVERGVRVRAIGKSLLIDLHIEVSYGVNLSAISQSISSKVKYTVEDVTGLRVARINIHVDGMIA